MGGHLTIPRRSWSPRVGGLEVTAAPRTAFQTPIRGPGGQTSSGNSPQSQGVGGLGCPGGSELRTTLKGPMANLWIPHTVTPRLTLGAQHPQLCGFARSPLSYPVIWPHPSPGGQPLGHRAPPGWSKAGPAAQGQPCHMSFSTAAGFDPWRVAGPLGSLYCWANYWNPLSLRTGPSWRHTTSMKSS